jgi:hypothetical protein
VGRSRGRLRRYSRTTLAENDRGDEIPLGRGVLDLITQRRAVGCNVDDDVAIRENLVVDGLARLELDVQGVRRLIVFEGRAAHSWKSRSLKAVWTVSPSARVTTRI